MRLPFRRRLREDADFGNDVVAVLGSCVELAPPSFATEQLARVSQAWLLPFLATVCGERARGADADSDGDGDGDGDENDYVAFARLFRGLAMRESVVAELHRSRSTLETIRRFAKRAPRVAQQAMNVNKSLSVLLSTRRREPPPAS